jgi:predicted DNA-binding transcriptional regulator YafY
MPVNKNALIRYHALDQCFCNFGRAYFMDDLIEACNNALYNFTGIEDGVKRRQIFVDISFMESQQGWGIPLERINEGKRVFYRYSDTKFSIKNQPVSEIEAVRIKEALMIFERFKGMPQFEWMEELVVRLNTAFNLKTSTSSIVGFESNPYLKGLDFFSDLFNAVLYKKTIEVSYQSFNQSIPGNITISPYFLKQYNNRWFLFGRNPDFEGITNLALDRIVSFKGVRVPYIENDLVDFDEYFEDIIGVTFDKDSKLTKIILEISKSRWAYIDSKPLHGSQKIVSCNQDYTIIELNMLVNKELLSLLFSFGADIKILEPAQLSDSIQERAKLLLMKYQQDF